jgi:hypothetical protein
MQRKTPIVLGGVCPLAWATKNSPRSRFLAYCFKATHTPPKITGVVLPLGLLEMPISTITSYYIIPIQAILNDNYLEITLS